MKKALALLLFALAFIPVRVYAFEDFVIGGSTYPFPNEDDTDWGESVTDWARAATADLNNKTALIQAATNQLLIASTQYAPAVATAQSTAALTTLITTTTATMLDQTGSTQTKIGTLMLKDKFVVGNSTPAPNAVVVIGSGTQMDMSDITTLVVKRASGTTASAIHLDGALVPFTEQPLSKSAVRFENSASTFSLYLLMPGGSARFKVQPSSPNIVMTGATTITGDLHITGNMAAATKTFKIPHPLNSDRWLVHGVPESNKFGLTYDGMAVLENGEAVVQLPDYFESICAEDGRSVQLTPTGGYSPLYVDGPIANGQFTVRTTEEGNKNQRFYWLFNGKRGDPTAPELEVEPLIVEGEIDTSAESEKSGFPASDEINKENAIKRARSQFKGYESEAETIIENTEKEKKR